MLYFIINPASGSGRGRKIWNQVEEELIRRGEVYRALISEKPGDLAILAEEACRQAEGTVDIVVLGGDGSLHETVQGIRDHERVRLAYIPTGSSNDLARNLDFPGDPLECLDRILEREDTKAMDLGLIRMELESGEVRREYFCDSAGIGFDAQVCEEVLHSRAKKILNAVGLGKLIYLMIALKLLLFMKRTGGKIRLDNGEDVDIPGFIFIACMNHRYEGGGFMFCPDAHADDGLADICAVGNLSFPQILRALPLALKGKHTGCKGIDLYRSRDIKILTKEPCWVHTDGEPLGMSRKIRITILPGKVQMRGL